ncbi:MAG: helix-turn-helix transcriptional regulator [Marmoricola sp.]|nr:helix-turn-helix transcriptional regulator [Marmoricola sp.]
MLDVGGNESLTTRERQVLGLLRQGLSDTEIATTLFISPRTVEKLIARLMDKTGARGRLELVTGSR